MRNSERNSSLDPDRNKRGNDAVTVVPNSEQTDSEKREMSEMEDINKDLADIGDKGIDNGMDAAADTDKAVTLDQNKAIANDSNELHITDVSLTDILDSSVEDIASGVEIQHPELPVVGSSLGHITESQKSIDLHSFNVLPSNASTPLGKAVKKGNQNDKQLRFTFKSHQNIDKSCEKTESKDVQVTTGKTQIQKTIENRLTQLSKRDSALPSTEACLEDDFDEESNTVAAGKLVYVKQRTSKMVRECSASSAKVKKAMKGMEKAKRELGMSTEKNDEIEKKMPEKAETNFKDNVDKTRKSGKGKLSKTDKRRGNEDARDSDFEIENKVTDGKSSNNKHHKKRKKQLVVSDSESDDETICAKRQKSQQQRDKNGGSEDTLSKVSKLDMSPGVSKKTLSKLQQFKFDESKHSVSSSSFLCNTSLSDSMLSGAMWTADKSDESSTSNAGTENISRGVIQTGTEDLNKSVGIRDDKNESVKPVSSKEKVARTKDYDKSVTLVGTRGSEKDLKLLCNNIGKESAKPAGSKGNDDGVKVVGTKDVDGSVNFTGCKYRDKSVNMFDNGPLVSESSEVPAVSAVSENDVKMQEPGRELKLVKGNEIVVDIEGSKPHSESTILGNRNTSPAWLLKLNQKLTSPNVLSQSAGNSTSEQKYKSKPASPACNAVPNGNGHSSTVSSSVIPNTLLAKQNTNSTLSGRDSLLRNESKNRSLIFSVADDLDKELDDIDFTTKF